MRPAETSLRSSPPRALPPPRFSATRPPLICHAFPAFPAAPPSPSAARSSPPRVPAVRAPHVPRASPPARPAVFPTDRLFPFPRAVPCLLRATPPEARPGSRRRRARSGPALRFASAFVCAPRHRSMPCPPLPALPPPRPALLMFPRPLFFPRSSFPRRPRFFFRF